MCNECYVSVTCTQHTYSHIPSSSYLICRLYMVNIPVSMESRHSPYTSVSLVLPYPYFQMQLPFGCFPKYHTNLKLPSSIYFKLEQPGLILRKNIHTLCPSVQFKRQLRLLRVFPVYIDCLCSPLKQTKNVFNFPCSSAKSYICVFSKLKLGE